MDIKSLQCSFHMMHNNNDFKKHPEISMVSISNRFFIESSESSP
jgi:hypothetical protein